MRKNSLIVMLLLLSMFSEALSQDILNTGRVTGNFQLDAQSSQKDALIGSEKIKEKILSNSFFLLNYQIGDFTAGIRYESYNKPILGIDPRYTGHGIANRFLDYKTDMFDVTAGNFYEQFGSGMILRSYEERLLGIDNSIDGVRFKIRPLEGVDITGLIGKQRLFWDYGKGIVRGADMNVSVNELMTEIMPEEYQLTLGGSIVSKYQVDQKSDLNLPENVLAWSSRFALISDSWSVDGEYSYKYNDPSSANNFTYNPGRGLILNANYFGEGLGISLNLHSIDNMDFRSDRSETGTNLALNYIPPLTRQHSYRLATIYPYSTQLNREMGLQADLTYTFEKKSLLGGRYGTTINLNYSRVGSVDTTRIDSKGYEYNSSWLDFGDIFAKNRTIRNSDVIIDKSRDGRRLYFEDINIDISRKISKEFKLKASYLHQVYDKDIMENQGSTKYGILTSNIFIAELFYKLMPKHTLRAEVQLALIDSEADEADTVLKYGLINGDWALFLLEYTIAPKWFFTFYDEYNYGNESENSQIHYLNGAVAYIHESTRFSFGYGRKRGGILCVGGVCREVPASNGFNLSITTSF